MRLVFYILGLWLLLPATTFAASCDHAIESDDQQNLHSAQANSYFYQFESGATWELCWHIDKHAGLVVSRVFYGAPLARAIQVLDAASIGQVMFKYDEDTHATHLLSEYGFGGENILPMYNDCEYGESVAGIGDKQICQRVRDINHLTKVRNGAPLRRHEVSLHARSRIGTHIFEQIWRFSEDGEISPALSMSGTINRFTNDARYGVRLQQASLYAASAALLVNWRLDFNINGTARNDLIDEIEFLPSVTGAAKQTISVKPITSEAARTTNSESFRGWRVSDSDLSSGDGSGAAGITRVGYYLDPQSSGYRYHMQSQPWSQFDFFVTNRRECEKLSSANNALNANCAADLHSFVNSESLQDKDPVVWFSLSRNFMPRLEDSPAISARVIEFKIIPFDWSAHTPFNPPLDTSATSAGTK